MSEPDRALLELLDALCTETITAQQQEQLNERLKSDPAARQAYLAYVDVHLGLRRLGVAAAGISAEAEPAASAAAISAESRSAVAKDRSLATTAGMALLALAAALGIAFLANWRPDANPAAKNPDAVPADGSVRLASTAGARFFGELAPPIASTLELRRDYVLLAGMAELRFPAGATAIVEGPAVFRILSDSSLGLDVGQCSVHAPPGAEGFRVETQQAHVVDRGTRFSIRVSETSDTEVHVVEGMADLYRSPSGDKSGKKSGGQDADEAAALARLGQHQARGLADDSRTVREVPFSPAGYRGQLPDRVISYQATTDESGGVDELESVTVQRGGQLRTYSVARLIAVEPIWFRGATTTDRNGHLTSGGELPARRTDVLRDRSLRTGLLNFGGSPQPLTQSPRMNLPEDPAQPGTPGLGIRFARPVTNRPGPDVVLFEMQTVTNPADGDAFHASPLAFAEGLRSHTVRGFDISMTSSEARKLAGFHLYRFDAAIRSLEELQAAACHPTPLRRNFRMLATGIDLSLLGYAEDAQVEGLFLQDAADDDHKCDPVFIGGFPDE